MFVLNSTLSVHSLADSWVTMILILLLWATVCSAIPLAQDVSPPTGPMIPESLLGAESSCMDMIRAQEALSSDYQSAFWPLTNTSDKFRKFDADFRKAGKDRFMKEFIKSWSNFQSWECSTNTAGPCERLDCDDLGENKNSPESAAAYQVMISFANIGQALKNMFDTLTYSRGKWAEDQVRTTMCCALDRLLTPDPSPFLRKRSIHLTRVQITIMLLSKRSTH